MKLFVTLVLVVHALIHLAGAAKAFNWIETSVLPAISKTAGFLWFGAFVLFAIISVLYAAGSSAWWMAGLLAIMLSQCLLISQWRDARWGTLANLVILLPVIMEVAGVLPFGFKAFLKRR